MTRANLRLTDYDAESRPDVHDMRLMAGALTPVLTMELDGAAESLGLPGDALLLAALGRAIERTIGNGAVNVDVSRYGTFVHPVLLRCAGPGQVDADEMLSGVHHALESLAVRRVPDDARAQPVSDTLFANGGTAATQPHLGYSLELRAHRRGAVVALDWWYDVRSFEPYTVAELAEQFPLALIELTSEATPPVHATPELALAH